MGIMTLANFREDLQSSLGGRGLGNGPLDRWINFAYLDLSGSVKFRVLQGQGSITTSAGTANYPLPSDSLNISAIGSIGKLEWISNSEYFRLNRDESGTPKKWTTFGGDIFLFPIPASVITYDILYEKEPVTLSTDTDRTVLKSTWDAAVALLSTHNGLMFLGEERRGMVWLQRAVNYIQTRRTDDELLDLTSGLGQTIADPDNKPSSNQEAVG